MTPSTRLKSRSGFSLIEMLVVIMVITILIAILYPVFIKVKVWQHLLLCQNNMHQMGVAYLGYTIENHKRVPGPNWRKARSRGWLYSDLKMDKLEDLETGQLWPYLNLHSAYRCPADTTPQEDPSTVPNRPNNSRMVTSYCMNGSVIKYGGLPYVDHNAAVTDPNEPGYYGYWETYRITQFKSSDILYWEADETKSGGWWWDGANFPWEGVTQRHVENASVSCVDGHVEWMRLDRFYDDVYANWPQDWRVGDPWPSGIWEPKNVPTRLWNVPGSSNGKW